MCSSNDDDDDDDVVVPIMVKWCHLNTRIMGYARKYVSTD